MLYSKARSSPLPAVVEPVQSMAPAGVKVYNPAFDFADHELISGIVTEYGIARPPYTESLKEIFRKKAETQGKK